ncbi:hypothetical protein [Paraburkholderia hayleyella]|uniref:hypothetical protein n=1 Tax=Paraburkholderia hayleyella TaxID=2152889 RepID=UPI0012924D33|nr:hypothetical protein [Paraburkholderia hayleyella]
MSSIRRRQFTVMQSPGSLKVLHHFCSAWSYVVDYWGFISPVPGTKAYRGNTRVSPSTPTKSSFAGFFVDMALGGISVEQINKVNGHRRQV